MRNIVIEEFEDFLELANNYEALKLYQIKGSSRIVAMVDLRIKLITWRGAYSRDRVDRLEEEDFIKCRVEDTEKHWVSY